MLANVIWAYWVPFGMQTLSGIGFCTLAIETLVLAWYQQRSISWVLWLPLVVVANFASFVFGYYLIDLLYPILPWDGIGNDPIYEVLAWIVAFLVSVVIEYGAMNVMTRRWKPQRLLDTIFFQNFLSYALLFAILCIRWRWVWGRLYERH